MVCSPVGLISLMDRGFGPVIAKLFPVKPEFISGFLSTAQVVHSTTKIMLTFISLLCYMIVSHCCHLSVTRTSFHFHWRPALSLVNFKNYMYNFCFFLILKFFVFTWKLTRGDRPHIFTGVKPLKTFYILLQWGGLFQGSYTLKFERCYSFYIADQGAAWYSLCSAGENCVRTAEALKCTKDNSFSSVKPEYPAF